MVAEKPEETKAEKFKRLANMRTSAALEKIEMLGRLANRDVYEYSENDVARIVQALEKATTETKMRLLSPDKPKKFSL